MYMGQLSDSHRIFSQIAHLDPATPNELAQVDSLIKFLNQGKEFLA